MGAHNVTPNNLYLKFNLRFSTQISGEAIQEKVENFLKSEGIKHKVSFDINAEPFYSEPKLFTDVVCQSIEDVQGFKTTLSCSGGTSDGRFISKTGCEIVELGPNLKPFIKSMKKLRKLNWND